MQIVALNLVLLLILPLPLSFQESAIQAPTAASKTSQKTDAPRGTRQLLAVRGEIVGLKPEKKGMILITIRPKTDFAEVTVVARENDMVGSSAGRVAGADLLGVLSNLESHEDDKISAAELQEGDVVSVIYDPETQNLALEIYIH
jgi:hypothetical protein